MFGQNGIIYPQVGVKIFRMIRKKFTYRNCMYIIIAECGSLNRTWLVDVRLMSLKLVQSYHALASAVNPTHASNCFFVRLPAVLWICFQHWFLLTSCAPALKTITSLIISLLPQKSSQTSTPEGAMEMIATAPAGAIFRGRDRWCKPYVPLNPGCLKEILIMVYDIIPIYHHIPG